MQKDSVSGTLIVATALCICCSVLVAGAAVYFKPLQDANKEFDIKKNLLLASGLISADNADRETVLETYKKVRRKVVDLETGKVLDEIPENFDQKKFAKDPARNVTIEKKADIAGIKTRSKIAEFFEVYEGEQLQMYILPMHGKGLWSTLYGFMALSPDFKTIKGLGFYQHAETPGLGGEVDNPSWKAKWVGKSAFDENFEPKITVLKAAVNPSDPEIDYKVDGLSGATITSNGVTYLVHYWLGKNGFGPFIKSIALPGGNSVQN